MRLLEDFMSLCRAVLQQDTSVLVSIEQFFGDLWVEEGILHFSLPALYQYLYQDLVSRSNAANCPDYKSFRQALYSSDFNTQLAVIGARIDVHDSSAKVDSSIYKLIKI